MSKVQEIAATIERLKPSHAELKAVRDWLEERTEGELVFPPEFEAKLGQSEGDIG